MGSGIQRICNLDGERVNTFIIDMNSDFDEVKRDYLRNKHNDLSYERIKDGMTFAEKRRVVLHLYMDGLLPVTVTDDCVYERMNDDDDNDIDNISYEVGALDGFERLKKRESDSRLAAGFRDSGLILAKSANCMLVIADNQNGYVIGCVPADTKDDANAAMRKVHEFLGTRSLHVPTSAWTSAKMKTYDEMTEEERNNYY